MVCSPAFLAERLGFSRVLLGAAMSPSVWTSVAGDRLLVAVVSLGPACCRARWRWFPDGERKRGCRHGGQYNCRV